MASLEDGSWIPLWWIVKHTSLQKAWRSSRRGWAMLDLMRRHFPEYYRRLVRRTDTPVHRAEMRKIPQRIVWRSGKTTVLRTNGPASAYAVRRHMPEVPAGGFVPSVFTKDADFFEYSGTLSIEFVDVGTEDFAP